MLEDFPGLDALVESFPLSPNAVSAPALHAPESVTFPLSTEPPAFPPAHSLDALFDAVLRRAGTRQRDSAPFLTLLTQQLLHAQEHVNPYDTGPSLAILDAPARAAGGWIVQLAERAGARCLLNPSRVPPHLGTGSGLAQSQRIAPLPRELTPAALHQADPDFILVVGSPGPGDDPWNPLTGDSSWSHLSAVRAARAVWVPGPITLGVLPDFMWFLVGWLQARPELIPSTVARREFRTGGWLASC